MLSKPGSGAGAGPATLPTAPSLLAPGGKAAAHAKPRATKIGPKKAAPEARAGGGDAAPSWAGAMEEDPIDLCSDEEAGVVSVRLQLVKSALKQLSAALRDHKKLLRAPLSSALQSSVRCAALHARGQGAWGHRAAPLGSHGLRCPLRQLPRSRPRPPPAGLLPCSWPRRCRGRWRISCR